MNARLKRIKNIKIKKKSKKLYHLNENIHEVYNKFISINMNNYM